MKTQRKVKIGKTEVRLCESRMLYINLKEDEILYKEKGFPETDFHLLDDITQLKAIKFLSEVITSFLNYKKQGGKLK